MTKTRLIQGLHLILRSGVHVHLRPKFEIVTTTAGVVSIRNNVVNEIMHNPVGPWTEANLLYIEQSNLVERLQKKRDCEFVVFDVGLGAAANSLATIACYERVKANACALRIISFEKDLELLRFALSNADQFAHFKGFETRLEKLLQDGEWSEGSLTWMLREGEFLDLIDRETFKADLIFYDPYSPKVNQEMWTQSCFEKIKRCTRDPSEGGTLLLTYSQATRIRTALICAGFYVGYGSPTGLKEQTTQAATDLSLLQKPLDEIWFQRWERSHERYPFDAQASSYQKIDEALKAYRKIQTPI